MKKLKKPRWVKVNKICLVLIEHIRNNKKDYFVLSIVFILGVLIGVIMINNSSDNSKLELQGYIKSFINNVGNKELEIDRIKLVKNTVISNLKIVFIIWLAGTTIIGIPGIYLIVIYKGISVGYTISAIMYVLGNWRGFLISFVLVFLNNLVIIPSVLMLNVSSLKVYRTLIRKEKSTSSIKQEMVRHTLLCLILSVPIIIVTIFSSLFSSEVISIVSKTIITWE